MIGPTCSIRRTWSTVRASYRLNLPFDTSRDETYEIYKNEVDDTYELVPDTDDPTTRSRAWTCRTSRPRTTRSPLSEAYLAELNESVPLPESLTLDQLKPQLLAAGIDVDALLVALTPVLTPEDAATLGTFAAEPIALEYVLSFDGNVAVEPVTGAEVRVSVSESFGARPCSPASPRCSRSWATIRTCPRPSRPTPHWTTWRTRRPSRRSSTATSRPRPPWPTWPTTATDLRRQVLMAKVWLPLALAAGAVLSLVVGAIVFLRRRPRPIDTTGLDEPHRAPRPDKQERDIVPAGRDQR